jgi:hypothetical protein
MWSRRRVIFVGVAGAIAAGAALVLPRIGQSSAAPKGSTLVQAHADMLRVVAAAVLGSALPADGASRNAELSRVVTAAGALIDNLPSATRREVSDLFGLLALKPARDRYSPCATARLGSNNKHILRCTTWCSAVFTLTPKRGCPPAIRDRQSWLEFAKR